ncbi:hypothetical protein NDU88_002290 [Pleurodeles waltl]|uniref:Uncharacterized protein n=1 Tax=Pleurodeles waltl TaxID=8319 RepID=A0AAV7PDL5_PLEWA|nr:hypothetical protein NDU88_002290 [Pleurodeles waltl]
MAEALALPVRIQEDGRDGVASQIAERLHPGPGTGEIQNSVFLTVRQRQTVGRSYQYALGFTLCLRLVGGNVCPFFFQNVTDRQVNDGCRGDMNGKYINFPASCLLSVCVYAV